MEVLPFAPSSSRIISLLNYLGTLVKNQQTIFEFSILFHCFICLSLYQHHITLLTVTLLKILTSHSLIFFLFSSLCFIILCRYKICTFLSIFLDPKANLSGPPTQSLESDYINYEILRISQGQFNPKFRANGCGSI